MDTTGAERSDSKSAKGFVMKSLRLYLITLLALSAVAWSVVGIRGLILHEPYPRNSLFVNPSVRFTDFTDFSQRVAHFGESDMLSRTDIQVRFPYPVPTIYAFLIFVRLFREPLIAYIAFVVSIFVAATCGLSLKVHQVSPGILPQLTVWLTLLLAFPVLFLIDRGNIEAVVWLLTLLGIVAYVKDWMKSAALFLALAASMKIYPGLFFLLFLAKRRYWTFGLAVVATLTTYVLALAGVGPTIAKAAHDSSEGAAYLANKFIIFRAVPEFDHSALGCVKQFIYIVSYHHGTIDLQPAFTGALRFYSIVIPIGVAVLYWFRLRHMPILNQFVSYVILCILLPYVSYEYTLVHLYLAWGVFLLFLLTDVVAERVYLGHKAIGAIMVSFAIVFTPQAYLILGRSFAFGGQIKAIFLSLILGITLLRPLPSSLFGDLEAFGDRSRIPPPG
jgi:Glycosyltransferase family 87